jgi:hypothetical protein
MTKLRTREGKQVTQCHMSVAESEIEFTQYLRIPENKIPHWFQIIQPFTQY